MGRKYKTYKQREYPGKDRLGLGLHVNVTLIDQFTVQT